MKKQFIKEYKELCLKHDLMICYHNLSCVDNGETYELDTIDAYYFKEQLKELNE